MNVQEYMVALCISYFDHEIHFIITKKKIYVKIQREKLFKLQTKVYFNNIDFVLKKKQNFVRSVFSIVERQFFYTNENSFFLSYLSIM